MTEVLFQFDECNYLDCQDRYRGENNREYYLGDYRIEAGSTIDVRAEKKSVGSSSIIQLRSRSRLLFDRSWSHIREDATDVVVLWFVRRGRLAIYHNGASHVAEAGDFALTRSMQPFSIECKTGDGNEHEVLHAIVPAHSFRHFLPRELKSGFSVRGGGRKFALAEQILGNLFEDDEEISETTGQMLLDSALALVAEALGERDDCFAVRQSLRQQRLQDVLRYIDLHLSDPALSAAAVAQACGISPRYLSSLLKGNGTRFSDYIWNKRMEEACHWLASTGPGDISIAEIAFRVGFKSPAHFSRMFKRTHQQGPRAFRNACQQQQRAVPTREPLATSLYAGASDTLQ